jgi:hypothetical protein
MKKRRLLKKAFVEDDFDWEAEWQGMPEYQHKNLEPYRTIHVHFSNEKDVQDFAKLVDQNITPKTGFLWYPNTSKLICKNKVYIDSEKSNES